MTRCSLLVFALALGGGGLLTGCDDIIEPNIGNARVTLLAPADSSVSTSAVQTFRWEAVEGASQYQLQVARPSFDNPGDYFLDTLVAKTSLATPLTPGTYRWRVRAVNGSYQTAYSSRAFRLDSTGSLTGQQLLLLQPANNSATAATTLTFGWAPLPMAERYIFSMQPSPRGTTSAFDTLLPATASVTLRLPRQSRSYQWKVTALNGYSAQVSATHTVEVDVTAPAYSTPTAPADNSYFLNLPITLTWTRPGPEVLRDSVYLYRADRQTLVTSFPKLATSASLTLSAGQLQPGTYHWGLRSFDRAGNRSTQSPLRSFVLQ